MLQHNEVLFELHWDLHDGRQHHDEGSVLRAGGDLMSDRLDDFGASQESVKLGRTSSAQVLRSASALSERIAATLV